MAIVIRITFLESFNKESNNSITKHFLGFSPMKSSTGINISGVIVQQLNHLGISIDNSMRDQGQLSKYVCKVNILNYNEESQY